MPGQEVDPFQPTAQETHSYTEAHRSWKMSGDFKAEQKEFKRRQKLQKKMMEQEAKYGPGFMPEYDDDFDDYGEEDDDQQMQIPPSYVPFGESPTMSSGAQGRGAGIPPRYNILEENYYSDEEDDGFVVPYEATHFDLDHYLHRPDVQQYFEPV